jgi:hypothetical protein
MGYSPGDFACKRHGNGCHWELKDGPRVVLWNNDEMKHLLDLDKEQFRSAYEQMRTIAYMIGVG